MRRIDDAIRVELDVLRMAVGAYVRHRIAADFVSGPFRVAVETSLLISHECLGCEIMRWGWGLFRCIPTRLPRFYGTHRRHRALVS